MTRDREPPGWVPDLVGDKARKAKARLRERKKRQRAKSAEKARARDALKPKKPLPAPKPRLGRPRPKTSTAPGKHYIAITAGAWRRMLVLALIKAGVEKTRAISAALSTDPTSVAQAISELKRLGALPSQIGRTPIRAKA